MKSIPFILFLFIALPSYALEIKWQIIVQTSDLKRRSYIPAAFDKVIDLETKLKDWECSYTRVKGESKRVEHIGVVCISKENKTNVGIDAICTKSDFLSTDFEITDKDGGNRHKVVILCNLPAIPS